MLSEVIPTPENWHWKIKPQDIVKLRLEDVPTMTKVYFDNYEKFQRIARNRFGSYWEDALQSIYIALPFCKYDNSQVFFRSLLAICFNLVYGYSRHDNVLSVDYDNGLSDVCFVFQDRYFIHEEAERLIDFLDSQKTLNDKQRDLLCATALGVCAYEGIFKDEQSYLLSLHKD